MLILDLLRSDGSIIVNKKLARSLGIDAAIMYSEIISKQKYFEDRNQLTEDGFFFNTVENMQEDTTLSKDKQLRAIKVLKRHGLIQQSNRGIPQKRYFKVVENEIIIRRALEGQQLSQNTTTKSRKTKQIDSVKTDSNNTNYNNPKSNNNYKDIYIISNENDVFSYYSFKFKEKFKKEHPIMNKEKMKTIVTDYETLASDLDIDKEQWFELIDYHFACLSSKNNGNILSFLALNGGSGCVYRYLEDLEEAY